MSGDNTPLGPVAEWAEAERLAREQVGWLLQYQLGGGGEGEDGPIFSRKPLRFFPFVRGLSQDVCRSFSPVLSQASPQRRVVGLF